MKLLPEQEEEIGLSRAERSRDRDRNLHEQSGSRIPAALPSPRSTATYHSVAWRTSTLACSLLWVLVFTEIRFLGFSVNLHQSWPETERTEAKLTPLQAARKGQTAAQREGVGFGTRPTRRTLPSSSEWFCARTGPLHTGTQAAKLGV